jgi:outer membrane protein assembly factor BamB
VLPERRPGTQAALVACDVETGEMVWKVEPPRPRAAAPGRGRRARRTPEPPKPPVGKFDDAMMAADPSGAGGYLGSWSTPVVVRAGGREELVVVHPLQVSAYDPPTGKELWTCKGLPEQAFASPAVGEGVLVALGRPVDGGGTRATAIKLDGRAAGDVTETHRLWQTHIPKECVGSPVIAGRHVYLITTFGSVVCLDLTTGDKVRERRLSGTGDVGGSWSSIVLANGKAAGPQPIRRGVRHPRVTRAGSAGHQQRRRRADVRLAGRLRRAGVPADVRGAVVFR